MNDNEFPKIQRGNGVMNDNLATLGDILQATLKKIHNLEEKTDDTKKEVAGVKKTIQDIDKESTPRQKRSLWLLVVSVIIGAISLIIAYAAFIR